MQEIPAQLRLWAKAANAGSQPDPDARPLPRCRRDSSQFVRAYPATPPPPDGRPFIKRLTVAPGPQLYLWIVSSYLYPYDIHYWEQQTIPCSRRYGECVWCRRGIGFRWYAFTGVMLHNTGALRVLPIPPAAFNYCPNLKQHNGMLRGKILKARRLGERVTSPLAIELLFPSADEKPPRPLPQLDLASALSRWWGCEVIPPDANMEGGEPT